jgi:hypothetical protein
MGAIPRLRRVAPVKRSLAPLLLTAASGLWFAAIAATAQSPAPRAQPASSRVDFPRQIQPILADRCLECHSSDKRKGGLSLATYADALEGGRNGAAIRPGNSASSLLIHRLRGDVEPQMPKDEEPLSESELALIRLWIDQGARETASGPPAPQPWEAPLTLERPSLPPVVWKTWTHGIDRIVGRYLRAHRMPEPRLVSDAQFARRAYLDVWGLLPTPEQLRAFVDDQTVDKRGSLIASLLADDRRYSEHWISFWNDLLRNEDGVTYFSENASRKPITDWLLSALESNTPYDRYVSKLLNPSEPNDPDGFLTGVNWRGETSAAVTPWMQASQNSAQIFLGINLKCNACHDSFVSKWKLKDAYSLAAYFSPDPRLQLFRCDVAQDRYAEPAFLFPEVGHRPTTSSLADRRAAAARTFTDPRMGRMPRTLVNRIWQRLLGRGIVANPDEMDGVPWSPELLDWLASEFVQHRYDLKQLIGTILNSRTYQMPSVARRGEPAPRGYVFAGPEIRRMTAEQFADAVGAITGEWNVYAAAGQGSGPRGTPGTPVPSMSTTSGRYAREWRVASTDLTRALGRPIRDQVISIRASHASTLQALELVNGEMLTRWLARGARRLVAELPPEPASLYNRTFAGRTPSPSPFEVDVSKANRLWLVVQDNGSNVPEALEPAWAQAEFVGPAGATPLSAVTPVDESASSLRTGTGPIRVPNTDGSGVRVANPSVLVYDITGRGFTKFRGVMGIENRPADIGATVNPQLRFYVFDAAPNMERLLPPEPGTPVPEPETLATVAQAIDRVFRHALGRAPSPVERRLAEDALGQQGRGERPSAEGLADLLWAILMKPEFQLIY